MKLFQLNFWKGRYLKEVVDFITKNDVDIVQLQEVNGGQYASDKTSNRFEQLQQQLPGYNGILVKTIALTNDPNTFCGSATFYKNTITSVANEVVWLKPFFTIADTSKTTLGWEDYPRAALVADFSINQKALRTINCHLAWGPTPKDEPYKIEQAKILFDYVRETKTPFIITGDFNQTKDSQVVRWLDSLAHNLTTANNITNTLNPNTHYAKHLFPAGLAVDFVYASNDIEVTSFQTITEDLSDHLGFLLEFSVQ